MDWPKRGHTLSNFKWRTDCAETGVNVDSMAELRLNNILSFQECYTDSGSHCYGCGSLNAEGLQIKSYWDGDETICTFEPAPYHTAFPGIVYGGLIASVIDCHGTGSAAAAKMRADGQALEKGAAPKFVTAALHVDYLKPTPLGPLHLRGVIVEIKGRKVTVDVTLQADGVTTAKGRVIAVEIPGEKLA